MADFSGSILGRDMRGHQPKRRRARFDPEWGTPTPAVNGNGQTTHFCRGCQRTLPVTEFYRVRRSKQGHYSRCRVCTRQKAKANFQANRTRRLESARAWKQRSVELRRQYAYEQSLATYGVSLVAYQEKLTRQGGRCAICGRTPQQVPNRKTDRFAIDHDHLTGQLRDLLCHQCNNGLGCFRDQLGVLLAAVAYLQRWEWVESTIHG